MALLSGPHQTCNGCRKRGRCWLAITDRIVILCRACWDPERDGPLPEGGETS